MKKIIVSVIALCSGIVSFPQGTYYAAAKAGLTMREQPGVNAKPLEKIPYGTKLLTVPDNDPRVAITSEGFNGFWRKIRYNGKTGYIVSSYALPYAPPKAGIKTMKDYFAQVSSASGSPLLVKRSDPDLAEAGESSLTKQYYKNGMEWHKVEGYEFGSATYMIPDMSIEQAFLLVKLVGEYAAVVAEKDNFPAKNGKVNVDGGDKVTEVEKEKTEGKPGAVSKIRIILAQGAITEFQIFMLDTQVVIFWSSGV
jgi:hypothetical protein